MKKSLLILVSLATIFGCKEEDPKPSGSQSQSNSSTQTDNNTSNCENSDTTLTVSGESYYMTPDSTVYTLSGSYSYKLKNATGCDSTVNLQVTINNTTGPAKVGDFRNGGVVFWVDPDNEEKGLIAAIKDLSRISFDPSTGYEFETSLFAYGCTGSVTGTSSTLIEDGANNTNNFLRGNSCSSQEQYAVFASTRYISPSGTAGWHLPSLNALSEMRRQRAKIDSTAQVFGGEKFIVNTIANTDQKNVYWSSTTSGSQNAHYVYFNDGKRATNKRNTTYVRARAIKSF